MWKTMTVKVQDPDSTATPDKRFEELNDFLQDCAADLEAVIGSLNDLKNTFELYDFTEKLTEINEQQALPANEKFPF